MFKSDFCYSLHPCLDFMWWLFERTFYCIYETDVIIGKWVFLCQKMSVDTAEWNASACIITRVCGQMCGFPFLFFFLWNNGEGKKTLIGVVRWRCVFSLSSGSRCSLSSTSDFCRGSFCVYRSTGGVGVMVSLAPLAWSASPLAFVLLFI